MSRMEGESSPIKSFETETRLPGALLILLLISDGQTHELLNETSGIHPT